MSLWSQLAQERELRGVSLDDVSKRTKISRTTLEIMESGASDCLPARVYLLGYLRSYAEAIGLDAEDVVLRFEEERLQSDEEEGSGLSEKRDDLSRRKLPSVVWLGLIGALAAAVVLWLVLSGS